MVNVVKTALNNEDYELLEQCPGDTASEKLRFCVRKAAVSSSDGPATEQTAGPQDQKALEKIESYGDGFKEGLKQSEQKLSETENRFADSESECQDLRSKVSQLQDDMVQQKNHVEKQMNDSFVLGQAVEYSSGQLHRIAGYLQEKGKHFGELDPLVKAEFLNQNLTNFSREQLATGLGIDESEIESWCNCSIPMEVR